VRGAFVRRLSSLAERDPKVFLITGDLGFGVLTGFAERFPRQYLNAGVAEQNMTGLATGLALEGRIVFVYSIANFPTLRSLEQLRNDVCYHEANVKVVAVGGGFSYGALGISHHATEDLSILRALPGIAVVAPGDRWEAGEATEAVASRPGACYLRLERSASAEESREGDVFELGRACVVRQGHDLTLITAGGILGEALKAAEVLGERGVQCRVLSMHTVKPLDHHAVAAACSETGGIITVEEHTLDGGLGSAVAEACMDAGVYPKRFARIGLRSVFSSIVGSQEYLRSCYGLDAVAIAGTAESLLRGREAAGAGRPSTPRGRAQVNE